MSAQDDLELITKIEPLLVEASLLEEGSPVDRKDVSDRISELLRGLKQSAAVTDQENTLALARTDAEFAIKAVQMALTSVPHACGPDPQRESKDQSLETRSPRRRRNVAIAVNGIYIERFF
jgi:hypothetical protein